MAKHPARPAQAKSFSSLLQWRPRCHLQKRSQENTLRLVDSTVRAALSCQTTRTLLSCASTVVVPYLQSVDKEPVFPVLLIIDEAAGDGNLLQGGGAIVCARRRPFLFSLQNNSSRTRHPCLGSSCLSRDTLSHAGIGPSSHRAGEVDPYWQALDDRPRAPTSTGLALP